MGQGEKYLDDGTQKNMEAVENARQSTKNVEAIANRKSQIAQITDNEKK